MLLAPIQLLVVAVLQAVLPTGAGSGRPGDVPHAAEPAPITVESDVEQGVVAPETRFATEFWVVESGMPGPTVMVIGGVHGNEPAGAVAAEEIRHWTLSRGRMIVVPHVNRTAIDDAVRWIPGVPRFVADLNRNFPRTENASPRGEFAPLLWAFIQDQDPDWILDLHEGHDFHRLNPNSVGSSVIAIGEEFFTDVATRMVDAVNETIEQEERHFSIIHGPVAGSLVRAAYEHLGISAMVLETTSNLQSLSTRARQHRILVHRLLVDLDMARSSVDTLVSRRLTGADTVVAIYDGVGATASGPEEIEQQLHSRRGIVTRRVGADDIRAGVLDQFDVVVVPGGQASVQAQALGEAGRGRVAAFVESGGGYVGVCAGAYLATGSYPWSLALLEVEVPDPENWRRGTGSIPIEWTGRGGELFKSAGAELRVPFVNGPIFVTDVDAPTTETLAVFRGDVAEDLATPMVGAPAVVTGASGRGRVLLASPHIEASPGLIDAAVLWAAGRSLAGAGSEAR